MPHEIRVLDAPTIRRLCTPADLVAWMRTAMRAVSDGEVELPLRRGIRLPGGLGAIGMMPGFVGGDVMAAGVKLVSLVPPERRKGSSHLGLLVLYDADGLVPRALLCGATVTALRTAAVSALATDALARADARILTICGAGEQADAHIEMVADVRAFDEIRVWARRKDAAVALAARHGGIVRAVENLDAAVAGADVICTVTAAREPFLLARHLAPGVHVNLVGASGMDAQEAEAPVVTAGRFFVDFIPSALDQASELAAAAGQGGAAELIAAELGQVLADPALGRRSPGDITVYKSLGVAAQDIVTASELVRRADERGEGSRFSM